MAIINLDTKNMTGYWMVKNNKNLKWPIKIVNPINTPTPGKSFNIRGRAGYVVDMDRPEEKELVRGQERFMEQVDGETEVRVQQPHAYPRPVVNWLIKQGYLAAGARPKVRPEDQIRKNEKKAEKPEVSRLPGLSESRGQTEVQPIRRRRRRKIEEKLDALESESRAD